MKERIFIKKAKEHNKLEEFIRKQFAQAKCGAVDVQYTPVATRIIIYTTTPGLVIGAGGERIKETAELLMSRFGLENPQIDVQKITNPDLDPYIVAQSIASALETGVSYKRLGNYNLQRIMNSGAIGSEIVVSGKLTGQRSRTERFAAGYLKKCGEPAQKDVRKAFALANPRLGNIGVTVKIMIKQPEGIRDAMEKIHKESEKEEKAAEVKEEKEASKEEKTEEVKGEKKEESQGKPSDEKKEKKKETSEEGQKEEKPQEKVKDVKEEEPVKKEEKAKDVSTDDKE